MSYRVPSRSRLVTVLSLGLVGACSEPPKSRHSDSDAELERQHELRREAETKLASANLALDSARTELSEVRAKLSAVPSAEAPSTPAPSWESSVKRVSEDHYRVIPPPLAQLTSSARARVRGNGIRLGGMRNSSLLPALGFKNGDLVTAVNGKPMTAENGLVLFEMAGKRKPGTTLTLIIEIERAGAKRIVVCDLVDSL